jgi:uncharacterized coiled-coil DUF342 family protein
LTEQDKKSELKRISRQLTSLKEDVNKANADTKGYAEKRDKLNAELRTLRQEIDDLKNQRDTMNQKVKTLKLKRDNSRARIKTLIQEIRLHRQKIANLKKKTPRENRQEIQKEFNNIEWKIQTTSLEMEEEKRLIERVKQLETQLNIYKKFDQHAKKISDLHKESELLKATVKTTHQELSEIAERSQNIHEKMISKIDEFKMKKTEADSLHRAYIQEMEKVRPLRDEIRKLKDQQKKLQVAIFEEDEKRKKNVEQALRKKLGSKAKDKLQRGEKLSWDEFRLLENEDSPD